MTVEEGHIPYHPLPQVRLQHLKEGRSFLNQPIIARRPRSLPLTAWMPALACWPCCRPRALHSPVCRLLVLPEAPSYRTSLLLSDFRIQ